MSSENPKGHHSVTLGLFYDFSQCLKINQKVQLNFKFKPFMARKFKYLRGQYYHFHLLIPFPSGYRKRLVNHTHTFLEGAEAPSRFETPSSKV